MLEPTEDPNVFINKLTKRKVKKGSQQFCKIMMEQNEKNTPEERCCAVVLQRESTQSDEAPPPSQKKIQKKTKNVLNEISNDNKAKLEKSKDIEGELRKLLYRKLCMTIHEHTPKNAGSRSSFKKKKRSSKTYPSSSSDTDSDTSSESE